MFTTVMEYNRCSRQKQREHGVSLWATNQPDWVKCLQRSCSESVYPGTVLVLCRREYYTGENLKITDEELRCTGLSPVSKDLFKMIFLIMFKNNRL